MDQIRSEKTGKDKETVAKMEMENERLDQMRSVRRKVEEDGLKVVVNFKEGHDIKKVSPVALSRGLRESVAEIIKARVLSNGSLMIICKSEEQRAKVVKLKQLCKKEVSLSKPIDNGPAVREVIYGIPVDEDLDKLRKNIRGGEIKSITRLKAWRRGEKTDSLSILLHFQGKTLPDKVTIGYMAYAVRAYIPPPLRCYKCQKYGHIAAY